MSFWEFSLTLLIFVPLVMLWLFTLTDLSRREDLSGTAKGLWAVAVVLLPLIGMLFYFVTRPDSPETRQDTATRIQRLKDDTEFGSTIDQLVQLAELHQSGTLSAKEFTAAKSRLLDS